MVMALLARFLRVALLAASVGATFQPVHPPRRPRTASSTLTTSSPSFLRNALYSVSFSGQPLWAFTTPPKSSSTKQTTETSVEKKTLQQEGSRVPNTSTASTSTSNKNWAQPWLDWALQSPLWKHVLVPAARRKIIDTARANGILWQECRDWLYAQSGPWQQQPEHQINDDNDDSSSSSSSSNIPDWYRQSSYHAYETGHLSWEAAVEIELASAAVGARNMPQAGLRGEAAFRQQFRHALILAGAPVVVGTTQPSNHNNNNNNSNNAQILDIGCATGTSTRWLANEWLGSPKDAPRHRVVGLDLSPYFCAVGTRLAELAPLRERTSDGDGEWICDIAPDPRISYQQGNGACTPFANNTFDVINLQFVAHELPVAVTLEIFQEAHRILKPGTGQLWFCEMDFQSPAYAAQRRNPLLFALIRATEPHLDEYADGQPQIWQCLQETFASTVIVPATGRHFAAVATKGGSNTGAGSVGTLTDLRFDKAGNYKVEDTHLQVWENKATASDSA